MIRSSTGSSAASNYSISSTDNDFAPKFSNASLALSNENSPMEAYTFSIPLARVIIPSSPITDDGSQATCLFENAQLTAKLYTRMPSQYAPNSTGSSVETSSADSDSTYKPWPFAVDIMQTSAGGADTPKCYKGLDGTTGTRITNEITTLSSADSCECVYKNYEP